MTNFRKSSAVATLLLFGAAGCVELDVENPNAPEAARALASAGDVESLIAGSYLQWWQGSSYPSSLGPMLSTMSFQHSAYPANFGMVEYSQFPRPVLNNDPAHNFYSQWAFPWGRYYRAIAAVRDGFIAIDEERVELSDADELRARAYGRFVQGLAHGSLALLFDQAFVVDETTDLEAVEPQTYSEVMAAALDYLDQAATLSQGASFVIPADWMSQEVPAAELARLARSYSARFRAGVARTPEERAAVNWDEVIADVNAGVTSDWHMNLPNVAPWYAYLAHWYMTQYNPRNNTGQWSQVSYQILGMADQSGNYQEWLGIPMGERHPNLRGDPDDPFLIITPDERFPQGNTLDEQLANQGAYYAVPGEPGEPDLRNWGRPDRGSFRWSYYVNSRFADWHANFGEWPWVPEAEMRLLKAEGLLRNGDAAAAAALINESRTEWGLNATDAGGTNTSCVPRLPTGECGDLFEMLKWEKRLEAQFQGMLFAPWYFDSRGWGDHYEGTPLQFPMPCREAQVLQMDCYTFGGVGGPSASPGSDYAWPSED